MKLSPEREAELLNELRLRVLLTNKMICRRYGISLATLKRRQVKALKYPVSQFGSEALRLLSSTSSDGSNGRAAKRVKAA